MVYKHTIKNITYLFRDGKLVATQNNQTGRIRRGEKIFKISTNPFSMLIYPALSAITVIIAAICAFRISKIKTK